jgi:hypothetical protein
MKSKTPANQVLIGLRREIEKENEFKEREGMELWTIQQKAG